MVDKPIILPEWASQDRIGPTGQYNVVEPPTEVKEEGWDFQEKPNRQWWNWFGRTVYDWINWLNQQESYNVTTDATGVALFPFDNALITIQAVDATNPNRWLRATGYKGVGLAPYFDPTSIQSNVLTLGTPTVGGDYPIVGGANVIVTGRSSVIPT